MKLVKKILSTLFLSSITISSAYAISTADVAIGGIPPQSSQNYVENIYGKPDKIENSPARVIPRYTTAYWGSGFKVVYEDGAKVLGVETSANNGLGTPAGLEVGQTIQTMYQLYGSPNSSQTLKNSVIEHYYEQKIDSNSKDKHSLFIVVDEKNKKVNRIRVYHIYNPEATRY